MGVVFILRILRVTEFSKVRKLSAERKIVKVLRQGKLTSLEETFLGLCDFNDDFHYVEGKFVENVPVINGWKVWLFVEGASTSDILVCDYFVS